jgi:hypothetical protein
VQKNPGEVNEGLRLLSTGPNPKIATSFENRLGHSHSASQLSITYFTPKLLFYCRRRHTVVLELA